ncbi:MAG: hypothetical protein QOJ65_1763 [Fimbriimonadaceae bacterium]|jgi:hypothetical protein|nr:hypothetical protein [Fimbriimonadaceae bacterium]
MVLFLLASSFISGLAQHRPEQLVDIMNTQFHERVIDTWKPHVVHRPQAKFMDEHLNLVGRWGRRGSSLKIRRVRAGYAVEFSTAGCLATWRLHRTATFSGGTVVLNRPVEPYSGGIFQSLYTIRIGEIGYLVPATNEHESDPNGFSPSNLYARVEPDDVTTRRRADGLTQTPADSHRDHERGSLACPRGAA